MVSPLGQRMVFQTSHTEAIRTATEIASQLQRDETFRKTLADRMAEDDAGVRTIPRSDSMRLEERQERQRQSAHQGRGGNEEDEEGEGDRQANLADNRVDFLA
jgi:hypothetical protein